MVERVIIITGAANGIGLACARKCYADGHKVVLADYDDMSGRAACESIDAEQRRAIFVNCDIADKLSVHNLISATLNKFGRIDVLINTAAIMSAGGVRNLTLDEFDQVLSVNLRGTYMVTKAVIDTMLDEIELREDRSCLTDNGYRIINISSLNDPLALSDQLAYTISSGGLENMIKALAIELNPYGIRVNAFCPNDVSGATEIDDFPDRMAEVVRLLLLDKVTYPTGDMICVKSHEKAGT